MTADLRGLQNSTPRFSGLRTSILVSVSPLVELELQSPNFKASHYRSFEAERAASAFGNPVHVLDRSRNLLLIEKLIKPLFEFPNSRGSY